MKTTSFLSGLHPEKPHSCIHALGMRETVLPDNDDADLYADFLSENNSTLPA
jgi:hypothetical protein